MGANEYKNENEAFIYFALHKRDDKLFYIGYIESKKRNCISDRIFKNSIKSGANTFKTKLVKKHMNKNSSDYEINEEISKKVDIYYIKILKPKDNNNSLTKYKKQLKELIKEKGTIQNSL